MRNAIAKVDAPVALDQCGALMLLVTSRYGTCTLILAGLAAVVQALDE